MIRILVRAIYVVLCMLFVACSVSSSEKNCHSFSPTDPTADCDTQNVLPPVGVYDSVSPPVFYRFIRDDGSDDPFLQVALVEETVPPRGSAFVGPAPVLYKAEIRMAETPNDPYGMAAVQAHPSIDGLNPMSQSLNGAVVTNGQSAIASTAGAQSYFPNAFEWILFDAIYTLRGEIPGTAINIHARGKLRVGYHNP